MNQTCEFGRFYYVIATGDVVRCVASKPSGPDRGRYWFVANDEGTDDRCFGPNQVALIPHMTSWDCELPKYPGEGWRFVDLQTESIEPGDQRFDGYGTWWDESCVDPSKNKHLPCRRRIEPDHVAELDKVSWSPPSMEVHWHAVKAELLALRDQNKRGEA